MPPPRRPNAPPPPPTPAEVLRAALSKVKSRGEVKALGARLDREPQLRAAALDALGALGPGEGGASAGLPEDDGVDADLAEFTEPGEPAEFAAPGEPAEFAEPGARGAGEGSGRRGGGPDGKRLVRWLLDRAAGAQVRTNPIHRDEAFTCAHCAAAVPKGGAPVRDHCPRCLRSLHVDVVPGDRAADCGGVLDPAALLLESGGQRVILHRCRRCGAERRVRAHPDDAWPPSLLPAELPGPAVRPA